MEENNTNPTEEQNPVETEELTPLTKIEAITGIITEPSYTFENIVQNKTRHYWVVPIIIFIVANLIAMVLFYADQELYSTVMSKQRKNLEEQFNKSIKEGKMTAEEKNIKMEQAEKFMNPKSPFAIAIAIGASVIGPFIIMVLVSVIYLLCFKIIKAGFEFTNILNVVGLTFIISSIAKILETVLSIITGNLTNFSLAFFFTEAKFGTTLNTLISKIDLFSIWALILTSIGLTIIGKVKSKAMYFFVFGLWIIWSVIATFFLPS
jgi:hypothetical protein